MTHARDYGIKPPHFSFAYLFRFLLHLVMRSPGERLSLSSMPGGESRRRIIMNYLIKTHRVGTLYKGLHFFVLNRGLNTGKVLLQPCPNCWVIQADCSETHDRLKLIVRSMHLSGKLRHELIGSVIPFVRIGDFKRLLNMYVKLIGQKQHFDKKLNQINKLTELVEQYAMIKAKAELATRILYMELLRGD